jgi:hypothetical protein
VIEHSHQESFLCSTHGYKHLMRIPFILSIRQFSFQRITNILLSCHFDVFVVNDEDKEGDEEKEEAADGTILYMAPPVCERTYR